MKQINKTLLKEKWIKVDNYKNKKIFMVNLSINTHIAGCHVTNTPVARKLLFFANSHVQTN